MYSFFLNDKECWAYLMDNRYACKILFQLRVLKRCKNMGVNVWQIVKSLFYSIKRHKRVVNITKKVLFFKFMIIERMLSL